MRTWIKSGWTMGLAAVFGLVAVSDANAQYCAGFPTAGGQASLGLRASFPASGDVFGVEGSYNMMGPLAVFGSANLASPANDGDDYGIFGAGVAFDISNMVPPVLPGFSVCPVAAISFSSVDGDTNMRIPLGVGFAADFGTPGGPTVMPYAIPQFVLMRFGHDGHTDTVNEFGIEAGFLARFGGLYAGVALNRLFVDQADNDFAVRVGWTFGAR